MARGFGTTRGSASTDRVATTLTTNPNIYSIHCWWKYNADTGTNQRFACSELRIWYLTLSPTINFQPTWTGTPLWNIVVVPASSWRPIGLSYNGSSTTNDPVMYLDGSSQFVTETTPPTGTIDTSSSTWFIGNGSAGDRVLNGDLAEVAIWNVILTAGEFAALGKGYSPLLIRPGSLIEYVPLVRSNVSRKLAAPTITGTLVQPHPRIIMPRNTARTQHGAVTVFYMRPDADDADGTWTTETGATTLFASIDEPTVDDADYIKSAETPQNDIARVRISDPTATPAEPFNVRYRYKKTGADTVDLIVRLKQSTTLIKAWTHSDVGTDFTTVTQTLSSGEFASITDFTDLFVEFEADTP